MRKWSIKLVAVGPNNTEVPANFIEKVTYKLHPTFEKPTRGKHRNKAGFDLRSD
jgi:transcription initiation factor TFIID/TFIIF subunit